MTAKRRLAQVEASLSPQALVVRWVEEVQAYPSMPDYARTILDVPVADAPLSRLARDARDGAKARAKGVSWEEADKAAKRAQDDVVFLYALVIELNQSTLDRAALEQIWGHTLLWWLNALLAGALGDGSGIFTDQELASWTGWFRCVAAIETGVRIHAEARRSLEAKYLGGHDSLFADAAEGWSGLERRFEHLGEMRDTARRGFASVDWAPDEDLGLDLGELVSGRARFLVDNAKVKAFELLDERERAVRIMERRLRRAA